MQYLVPIYGVAIAAILFSIWELFIEKDNYEEMI